MTSALDQLERSHRRHDDEMTALVDAAGAGDLDSVADSLAFFDRTSARHFADEEESLFPRLRARDASLGDQLDRIVAEHREHEELQARLRAALDARRTSAVLEAAVAFEILYRRHVAEEDALFATVGALLTPADHEAIQAEMDARRGRR